MTRQEAHRLFERLRAQFAAHRPELRTLRLVLRKRHFLRRPAPRDLAWYETSDGTVNLMEAALAGPAGRVEGLLAHELGHALDADATRPYAERRADALAKRVLGVPVRYDDGDVQNLHHGVTPRPARLHENREPEMKRNPAKDNLLTTSYHPYYAKQYRDKAKSALQDFFFGKGGSGYAMRDQSSMIIVVNTFDFTEVVTLDCSIGFYVSTDRGQNWTQYPTLGDALKVAKDAIRKHTASKKRNPNTLHKALAQASARVEAADKNLQAAQNAYAWAEGYEEMQSKLWEVKQARKRLMEAQDDEARAKHAVEVGFAAPLETYTYGMRLRPPSSSTIPQKGLRSFGSHKDFGTFGTAIYSRRLGKDEVKGYNLEEFVTPEEAAMACKDDPVALKDIHWAMSRCGVFSDQPAKVEALVRQYREPEMKRNPKKGYKMPETQARHTAEGLLARMKADGADTFAKKVAWVKKHMPSIDRPRTFVGWVTKGERGRVVLQRNPTPAYHRSRGDAELLLAEDSYRKAQALRRRGDASGSHDALIHAHRMAALAEADLLDGASPRAADAKRLAWWKAYSGLAADKRRNPRRSR